MKKLEIKFIQYFQVLYQIKISNYRLEFIKNKRFIIFFYMSQLKLNIIKQIKILDK